MRKVMKYAAYIIAAGVAGFGLLVCAMFVVIAVSGGDGEETAAVSAEPTATDVPADTPTATPPPTETSAPTATPVPTSTPTPAPTLEPLPALDAAITDALGRSNRDIDDRVRVDLLNGILDVRWSTNEVILVRNYRTSIELDAVDILEAVAASGLEYETISIVAEAELVDQLGNASENPVIRAEYPRSIIDQINFDNFRRENVFEVSDSLFIHPALLTE